MPRKMKESGVEWLGQIPDGWELRRGKTFLRLLSRIVEDTDDVITCFRDGEVTLRKNRREEGFTNALKECGYQGVEPGDLVVHGMDGFAGAIGISDSRGKASPVLNVMDTDENKRFVMYYLRVMAMCDVFLALSTGIRVRSCDLRWNKLGDLEYLLPPRSEQQRIAAFLDERCAKIDGMITEAKASIEDYKKWKQSIIFEAVTGKREKNLKPSGIEWVGKIPDGWGMAKASVVFSTITDYVASGSFADLAKNVQYKDVPDYARLIRTADVSGKAGSLAPIYIDKKAYNFLSNSNLFGGEIMLPNIGASVGDAYLIPNLYEHMSLAPNSIMLRTKYEQKYYYYYFLSGAGRKSLEDIAESTAQPKFNKTDFRNLRLPLPPVETQRRIAAELDEKCAAIDKLVGEKEALIADLEAYKKSLIFETVTGKREVA